MCRVAGFFEVGVGVVDMDVDTGALGFVAEGSSDSLCCDFAIYRLIECTVLN